MKTSIVVKLLIAVALGVFIWFVVVSIQTPRKKPVVQETVELREELLNRAEGVTVEIGDVRIEAEVQETYRNMEVHYQGFTMTRETEARKMVITGKTAQMKSEGSDVSFVEMEGNIHVETDDGLTLDSETLNYEEVQKRIFSNTPVNFTLNNLKGKSKVFIHYTEQRLLHLQGRVDCTLLLDEEEGQGKGPRKRVRIRCHSLDFDQANHLLTLEGNVKVAQAGSYLMGSRLEADLTEDNKQFLQMRIFDSETKEIPDESNLAETAEAVEAEAGENAEETTDPKSGISYHAGGIKNLKAKELTLDFKVGPGNPMEKVTATEKARLHIAPTSRQIELGKTDEKKISGDVITAHMGDNGKGIKTINVLSRNEEKKAVLDIRPSKTIRPRKKIKGQKRKKSEREQNLKKPRIITAKEFNAKVDEETGEISEVVMTGGTKMEQGDLEITGRSGRYIAAEEKLNIEGSPVLVDKVKRVTGKRMVVSLDIGDLTAEGKVRSIFSPTKKKKGDNPGIFAIAGGNGHDQETIISSDTLQFDYKKNILRYDKSVRVTQGDTHIKCESLTIMQDSSRLIALGKVNAELIMATEQKKAEKVKEAEKSQPDNNAEAEKAEAEKDKKLTEEKAETVNLSGDYLEINKPRQEMFIRNNAKSVFEGMIISGDRIIYHLAKDDSLLNFEAIKNVRIDIDLKQINGDKAEFDVKKKILVVTGKEVKYTEEGKLEGNYSKLVYNMNNGTMEFFARDDQLVKTKISN